MGSKKHGNKKQCPHCNRKFGLPGYYTHVKTCKKKIPTRQKQDTVEDYDYLVKCVLVGDEGCGKAELVANFTHGYFLEKYKLTIGVEFAKKIITLKDGVNVVLQIWDTGGQERFDNVRPLYYRGAMGAIVVFDLTNRESFDHIRNWIEEIRNNAGDIPIILLENTGYTSNLKEERVVSKKEVLDLAKEMGVDMTIEGSVLNGSGLGDPYAILSCFMVGVPVPKEFILGNHIVRQVYTTKAPIYPKPEKKVSSRKVIDILKEALSWKPGKISKLLKKRISNKKKK